MSAHRLAIVALSVFLASAAHAQIPDTFTNLKVLPKDIQKPELVHVMREFSSALGVRCAHCHVSNDAVDLSKVDFAADDKQNKIIARVMMGMTKGINAALDSDIGAMRPAHLTVTCFTCHHGNQRPETLEYALVSELDQHGIDSTLVKYRRLREEFYGRAAYDFGEWSLISIAEDLTRDPAQAGAALALLNENLTHYPESAGTYARAAETYLAIGDTTAAMTNFAKAQALAPDDPWLQRRVERLKPKQ
jgi:tetratricopeptide (TPR) repeat protein